MSALQSSGYGTSSAVFYNIPANFVGQPATFTVPGQNNSSCGEDTVWSQDPLAPASNTAATEGVAPFGSTAGKKYLVAEHAGTGPNANAANPPTTTAAGTDAACVTMARSSSAPGVNGDGSNLSGFEYNAFAMDAVSWASTSLRAPATLTQAQLLNIYNCTVTDWGAVGGTPGPIQRYFPQSGSGTRSFFISDILGQASSYSPPTGVAGCPDPILIEENEGQQILKADTDTAILPYSAGVWDLQQSNSINPTLDRRVNQFGAVAQLKGITTAATTPVVATPIHWVPTNHDFELDTAGVVQETNVKVNITSGSPAYPGIRYVYNVLDPANPGYAASESLFGFTNVSGGAKSPICDNLNGTNNNSIIALNALQSAGFALLNGTTNINGNNAAGSTCRQFKVA